MDKNKVLYLNSAFSIKDNKDIPTTSDKIDSIFIEGYASTNNVDRDGDVVPTSVWEKGIQNYLKNPIILSQHDHDDPVGRMISHKIDKKGLWIRARISAAAKIFNLVKDNVLTAFSIGFKVLDAEYNSDAEVFMVKELELVEISIVSVPCNQDTLFSLAKAFDHAEEFMEFKKQFTVKDPVVEQPVIVDSTTKKEWNMNPEEIKLLLAETAKSAAEQATKSILAAQAAQAEATLKKVAEDAAFDARVKAAVATHVSVGESGAERLLAEVTKRFEDQNATSKTALEGIEAAIKEKTAELAAIQKSKMQFGDSAKTGEITYAEKEMSVLLSKITGKSIENTKYGKALIEKAGNYTAGTLTTTPSTNHVGSGIWELEVSLSMESEVRRRLVIAPTIRSIAMQTNVMSIPVNPEAGTATWVTNAQFGAVPASVGLAGASAGQSVTHQLKEVVLNSYKLATNEYMNYEEEEDALIVLMPIVRDAMVRRVARSVDRAYLNGANAGTDPVKGLARYEVTSLVTPPFSGQANVANLRSLRKGLGAWGLDPSELVFLVSTEVYYDLLDDTTFQSMNQVGVQATLLTGQVGQIGNTPVLVSGEFLPKPTAATVSAATVYTSIGAICFAPGNFLAGNQRGLRFDTQELIETQRRVLVASLRTGMTQLTTNLGAGVSTLRWS